MSAEVTGTIGINEPRVLATDAALDFIAEIRRDHPDILFHQSGGCCDGSSPMCYPADDYIVGDNDVKLGEIGGVPVYISASQFEVWKHTQLIIDVVPGRGACSRSTTGGKSDFSRGHGCSAAARLASWSFAGADATYFRSRATFAVKSRRARSLGWVWALAGK